MAAKNDLHTATDIFKRLGTADERKSFIQSLLASLPRAHVRDLTHHVAGTHFNFDIISGLPIEILCMTFKHLPIYQAFQLRRVSKTWLQKLSAPELVESLLQPWFPMGDVDLRMPDNVSREAALAIKAEHVDAFKTGNPFSMVKGAWDLHWEARQDYRSRPVDMDYSHGRLAWIEGNTQVRVKNLELDQETLYTPSNREQISTIRLSCATVVAVTTASGRCYVWDCATGSPHSFQLPSALVFTVVVKGKSLAILSKSEPQRNHCTTCTTWNLESRRTRSFPVPTQSRLCVRKKYYTYDVTMTEDSVVILELDMGPPDQIFFTRYTLEGKIIANGASELLPRTFRSGYLSVATSPPQESAYSDFLINLDHFNIRDETNQYFRRLRNTVFSQTLGIVRIIYDLRHDRIKTLTIPCHDLESGHKEGTSWYFWKDVVFRYCHDKRGFLPSVASDLHTGVETDMRIHDWMHGLDSVSEAAQPEGLRRERLGGDDPQPVLFFGDEIYMVCVFASGFTAYCYDKNIEMAHEDIDFRRRREVARVERMTLRDHQAKFDTPGPRATTGEGTIEDLEAELALHEKDLWNSKGMNSEGVDDDEEEDEDD
ncbi:MAG: hypothetical protein Q9208_000280 [Pyrenodesmia sp. 3 TL-2023]